jgi:predicted lipid carrier protein YhbT
MSTRSKGVSEGVAAPGADATAAFLRGLESHGHHPLLAKAKGTLRVDLDGAERTDPWFVAIDHGQVSVSRTDAPADCVIRADRAVFDQLVAGEANATAALLRGTLRVEGALDLMLVFQRLFPSPPGARANPSSVPR